MKHINRYIISLICVAALFAACNEDFLDRAPQTAITGGGFFKTVSDVEAYVNWLYTTSRPGYANQDWDSDNVTTYTQGDEYWNMIRGLLNRENVDAGSWNVNKWAQLRGINYLLDNVQDVSGTEADLQHFIGIARLFRAWFYIEMVNRFSDVPWIDRALPSNDPDIYNACDPRTLVVDNILADLEFASANIKTTLGNRTRINRYAALAVLSRFCLYEGTFRRYHPELNLASTAEPFLQRAATAAEEIMNSGVFEITGQGVLDLGNDMYRAPGYQELFNSMGLGGNAEVILWADQTLNATGARTGWILSTISSLSRSLMESFLMKDGSRFTAQPGYATKTYVEVFKNRDPRFAQVFAWPGFSYYEGTYYAAPRLGGYGQLKFHPIYEQQKVGDGFYGAFVIFRYGEVLLNYAEAKAELGTLTQNDLDRSITLLRGRVEMPALNMATANSSIDPVLEAQYPGVSGANKGVLLEIRRERRVELACEGLRQWDLHRWYAGRLLGEPQQGIYIPALGTAYDVTGDGVDDVVLLNNVGDEASYSEEEREKLQFYYLHDENGNEGLIYLENGTSGHVMMTTDISWGKEFKEPQYYYRPIPIGETVLNPNLKQPFGW